MRRRYFLLILATEIAVFFSAWYFQSRHKELWGDETYGIGVTASQTALSLIIQGAHGQGSPSPFYYLLLKSSIAVTGTSVSALHATPEIYWRFISGGALALSGILFAVISARIFGSGIALLGAAFLMFSKSHFYFSAEARPYSVWVLTTMLLMLGLFFRYKQNGWWWAVILLAASATASFFQLTAVIASLVLTSVALKTPVERPVRLFVMLGTGVAVSLYYISCSGKFAYTSADWGTWPDFWTFALRYRWVLAASVLMTAYYFLHRKEREASVTLAVVLLFVMSPFIFWLTRHRGFFFNERQYIYWATETAVLMVMLLVLLRDQWASQKWRLFINPWNLCWIVLFYHCWNRLDPKSTLDFFNHSLGSPFTLIK